MRTVAEALTFLMRQAADAPNRPAREVTVDDMEGWAVTRLLA